MNETSAICLPLPEIETIAGPDVAAPEPHSLRIAPPALAASARRAAPVVVLRDPDLVADLRRARATRLADRYEWLALRRRRAQIAARRAIEG
jgi:hypothetical protein